MEVTKININEMVEAVVEQQPITEEKLVNEYKYQASMESINKMVTLGLITEREKMIIQKKLVEKFASYLVGILPNTTC